MDHESNNKLNNNLNNDLNDDLNDDLIIFLNIDLTNTADYKKPKSIVKIIEKLNEFKQEHKSQPVLCDNCDIGDNIIKECQILSQNNNISQQESNLKYYDLNTNNFLYDNGENNWINPKNEYLLISERIQYKKKTIKYILNKHDQKFQSQNLKSQIHCWHCYQIINNKSYGIPIKLKNNIFYLKGFFCSFNCALTYNYYSNESTFIIQERESLIRMLFNMNSENAQNAQNTQNTQNSKLIYAPPKEVLKIFGGNMTISEFQKNNNYVNIMHSCFVYVDEIIDEMSVIEEIPIKNF